MSQIAISLCCRWNRARGHFSREHCVCSRLYSHGAISELFSEPETISWTVLHRFRVRGTTCLALRTSEFAAGGCIFSVKWAAWQPSFDESNQVGPLHHKFTTQHRQEICDPFVGDGNGCRTCKISHRTPSTMREGVARLSGFLDKDPDVCKTISIITADISLFASSGAFSMIDTPVAWIVRAEGRL